MATRRQVRERLSTLMAESNAFDAVYKYVPLDLRGQDRVLCIYSDRTRHEMLSKHLNNSFYRFFLETYVLRQIDETGAEDTLDDMHETIRAVIRANVGDSAWAELNLERESAAFFASIATVPYRIERHSLIVKVTST